MSGWRSLGVDDVAGWARGEGGNHLVLLHGGPGFSDYMEGLGDLLADELGESWTVVRYQQRGLAPSTTHGPFTIEQSVTDLFDLCGRLDHDGLWLLGHSWGGHLAMHALLASGKELRGGLIMDPLGAVSDGGQAAMGEHFAAHMTPEEATQRARLDELSAKEGPSVERGLAGLRIIWPYYFSDPASAPSMPPLEIGGLSFVGLWGSIESHFKTETLVRGLPTAYTPALFLAGAKSPIPCAESERSAALMPNARVVTLPTGHFPWMENPAATVEAVTSFLRDT